MLFYSLVFKKAVANTYTYHNGRYLTHTAVFYTFEMVRYLTTQQLRGI